MADSTATTPDKIVIKHRHTDAVLFEFQPTGEQQEADRIRVWRADEQPKPGN